MLEKRVIFAFLPICNYNYCVLFFYNGNRIPMKNKITITSLFMALISVFSLAVYASTENTLFNDNIQPVEVTQSETYSTTIPQNVLRGIRNMKDAEENPNVVP
jgi:hypothetical protein